MRIFAIILYLLSSLAVAAQPVRRENIEWTDVWMPHSKDNALPRVLLIGDSITRAYFPMVEEKLKDKAYVCRIATSKAIGDPALLEEMAVFLKEGEFAVIHLNIGMHGWDYTEAEYEQHFPALIAAVRRAAPNAKLIWGQTTPVRKDKEPGPGPANSRIARRNAIAKAYAEANHIPVDDLHTLMLPHADLHSDDVHFNKEGSAMLAAQVATEIARLL